MEDDTLNNVLNMLQNVGNNNSNQTNNNMFPNNDIQTLLIKFLLSGGLSQIMNMHNQNDIKKDEPATKPEKPRTIDLTNYQRLD